MGATFFCVEWNVSLKCLPVYEYMQYVYIITYLCCRVQEDVVDLNSVDGDSEVVSMIHMLTISLHCTVEPRIAFDWGAYFLFLIQLFVNSIDRLLFLLQSFDMESALKAVEEVERREAAAEGLDVTRSREIVDSMLRRGQYSERLFYDMRNHITLYFQTVHRLQPPHHLYLERQYTGAVVRKEGSHEVCVI